MKKYDQQLERVQALKDEPLTPVLVAEVRKALANKSNYLVSKAACVAAHHRVSELIPDLLAAFHRFLLDAVKTDPQCWAKNAIAKSLADLGHDEPEVYLTGLKHVQPEPVWGGVEDTAGTLRAQCAVALVQCRSLSDMVLLSHLLSTLVDPDKTVRIEGARAVAQLARTEAALLLRLKALTGDAEPEVTGACLAAVLSIEGAAALGFVEPFLTGEGDAAAEAALALGLARLPGAVPMLATRYSRERDKSLASVLLTALAISQQPEAMDVLVRVIETEGADRAAAAIDALVSARMPDEALRHRIVAAARVNLDQRVQAECERRLPVRAT